MVTPVDQSLFPGLLSSFADKLAWAKASDEPAMANGLLDPLTRFQHSTGGPWQPACSFWAQTYFNTLLIPALCLLGSRETGAVTAITGSFCPATGTPLRVLLHRRPERAATAAADIAFLARLDAHLQDVIGALHRTGGLSARMLGESAGRTARWTLDQLHIAAPDRALQLSALLARSDFAGLQACGQDPAVRRFCCLRYRVPGFGPCPDICPRGKKGCIGADP